MDAKAIFLTGASGLLGSHISKKLQDSNFKLIQLSRSKQSINPLDYYVKGDLLDPVSYEDALDGLNTLIHCGALISYDAKDRKQLYQTNVEATRSLINASLYKGIKNFIFISSAGTMLRSADELLVSDRALGQPIFNSYYAETKYLAELEVWRGSAEGLNVCILNPSLILGEASWEHSSMQIFQKVQAGLDYFPPGNLGLIAAEDIASLVLKVLNENLWNKQFLLNAESWTYHKFLNTIAKALNQKPIVHKANKWTANFLALLDGIASRVTGKKPLICPETIRSSFKSLRYDDSISRNALKPEYQDMEGLIYRLCEKQGC